MSIIRNYMPYLQLRHKKLMFNPGAVQERRSALQARCGRAGGIWKGCACAFLHAQESAVS